jgi:hypothetical protein
MQLTAGHFSQQMKIQIQFFFLFSDKALLDDYLFSGVLETNAGQQRKLF